MKWIIIILIFLGMVFFVLINPFELKVVSELRDTILPGSISASANQPDNRTVSYEFLDLGKVVHVWNEYDDYYFNRTSGIQFSNYYDEYWSRNIFCGGFKIDDEWEYVCNDELPFEWSIESDNETYVNITGYRDVTKIIVGKEYKVRFVIRYHLANNFTAISIIPYAKNIGTRDIPVDLGFAWHVRDINIGANYSGNMIRINLTEHNMSDNLDLTFTKNNNIDVAVMHSNVTGNHMVYSWDPELNFKYTIKSEAGQINAPTTLLINAGPLSIGQEKQTTLKWIDDGGCTWTCQRSPTTQQDIFTGSTYQHGGNVVYTGGSCTGNANIEFQLDFPAVGTTINTTTNLSMTAANPQPFLRCTFGNCLAITRPVTGDEEGIYNIRNKCIYSSQTKFSASTIINVTESPDMESPNITLFEPANLSVLEVSQFNLTCFVSDATGVDQVRWYGNWSGGFHIIDVNNTNGNASNHTILYSVFDDFRTQNNFSIPTESGVSNPLDFDWNGTDFWITDLGSGKRVVRMNATGANISEFSISVVNLPLGLANDGTQLLVHDRITRVLRFYFYNGTVKDSCVTGGGEITGLDANGTSFWAADDTFDVVVQYNYSCFEEFNFSIDSSAIEGVTQNGEFIWVPDPNAGFIRTYLMNGTEVVNQRWEFVSYLDNANSVSGGDVFTMKALDTSDDEMLNMTRSGDGVYQWTCDALDTVTPVANRGFPETGNFTFTISSPAADTCTYTSGDWFVECSDNCVITSDTFLPSNDLILNGSGSFNIQANITVDRFIKELICSVVNRFEDNNELRIKI